MQTTYDLFYIKASCCYEIFFIEQQPRVYINETITLQDNNINNINNNISN